MAEIRDRTFTDELVETDGNTYYGCTFNSASLGYAGGEHPLFEDCTFNGLSWYFSGPALRTIQLLQGLNNSGVGESMVAELFRQGNYIGEGMTD